MGVGVMLGVGVWITVGVGWIPPEVTDCHHVALVSGLMAS